MDKIVDCSRRTINYTIRLNEQTYSPLLGVGGRQPLAAHRQQDWREDDLAERGPFCTSVHNLPFEDWTQSLGSERLTGALLDRLTQHVSIRTMNGDSYRLKQSAGRRRTAARAEQNQATPEIVDPDTGEITTT